LRYRLEKHPTLAVKSHNSGIFQKIKNITGEPTYFSWIMPIVFTVYIRVQGSGLIFKVNEEKQP